MVCAGAIFSMQLNGLTITEQWNFDSLGGTLYALTSGWTTVPAEGIYNRSGVTLMGVGSFNVATVSCKLC
ncbi:unnamed protein product, partial [Mesorhabditis belari]|uniref:Uncharacterized protein n=1 Tax=Mesorhabditis belari TaxID=2138241 RepID=A0AAF3EX15_9BILA